MGREDIPLYAVNYMQCRRKDLLWRTPSVSGAPTNEEEAKVTERQKKIRVARYTVRSNCKSPRGECRSADVARGEWKTFSSSSVLGVRTTPLGYPGVGKRPSPRVQNAQSSPGNTQVWPNTTIYSLDMARCWPHRYQPHFEERLKAVCDRMKPIKRVLFIRLRFTYVIVRCNFRGVMDCVQPAVNLRLAGNRWGTMGSTDLQRIPGHTLKKRCKLPVRFQKIDVNEPSVRCGKF